MKLKNIFGGGLIIGLLMLVMVGGVNAVLGCIGTPDHQECYSDNDAMVMAGSHANVVCGNATQLAHSAQCGGATVGSPCVGDGVCNTSHVYEQFLNIPYQYNSVVLSCAIWSDVGGTPCLYPANNKIYRFDDNSPWSENTITWNNQISQTGMYCDDLNGMCYGSNVISGYPTYCVGGTVEYNLTAIGLYSPKDGTTDLNFGFIWANISYPFGANFNPYTPPSGLSTACHLHLDGIYNASTLAIYNIESTTYQPIEGALVTVCGGALGLCTSAYSDVDGFASFNVNRGYTYTFNGSYGGQTDSGSKFMNTDYWMDYLEYNIPEYLNGSISDYYGKVYLNGVSVENATVRINGTSCGGTNYTFFDTTNASGDYYISNVPSTGPIHKYYGIAKNREGTVSSTVHEFQIDQYDNIEDNYYLSSIQNAYLSVYVNSNLGAVNQSTVKVYECMSPFGGNCNSYASKTGYTNSSGIAFFTFVNGVIDGHSYKVTVNKTGYSSGQEFLYPGVDDPAIPLGSTAYLNYYLTAQSSKQYVVRVYDSSNSSVNISGATVHFYDNLGGSVYNTTNASGLATGFLTGASTYGYAKASKTGYYDSVETQFYHPGSYQYAALSLSLMPSNASNYYDILGFVTNESGDPGLFNMDIQLYCLRLGSYVYQGPASSHTDGSYEFLGILESSDCYVNSPGGDGYLPSASNVHFTLDSNQNDTNITLQALSELGLIQLHGVVTRCASFDYLSGVHVFWTNDSGVTWYDSNVESIDGGFDIMVPEGNDIQIKLVYPPFNNKTSLTIYGVNENTPDVNMCMSLPSGVTTSPTTQAPGTTYPGQTTTTIPGTPATTLPGSTGPYNVRGSITVKLSGVETVPQNTTFIRVLKDGVVQSTKYCDSQGHFSVDLYYGVYVFEAHTLYNGADVYRATGVMLVDHNFAADYSELKIVISTLQQDVYDLLMELWNFILTLKNMLMLIILLLVVNAVMVLAGGAAFYGRSQRR